MGMTMMSFLEIRPDFGNGNPAEQRAILPE
jgi:hypothetical protein